jgi:glycosyltransferase involved in cell wall biosynthesis
MLKVAIFHDYIGAIGGAERLVLTLARALGADVITTDLDFGSVKKLGFQDINIISLGPLFKAAPFRQLEASLKFALCNFPDYDFYIFSGNWAHFAASRHKPNLWYCHTPTRAFYDLEEYVLKNQKTAVHRMIALMWTHLHRWFDQRTIRYINKIVANSQNTKERIKKYYNIDADVVYPPISTDKFRFIENGPYWLAVNRLYPEKRIYLQMEAFCRLPQEKLKIVGWLDGKDNDRRNLELKFDIPSNVEVLGSVPDDVLADLYGRSRGFICTAMDEDFGMAPVEAMAAGKPVVATKEGGYLESVVDGVTGRLVEADVESIVDAVLEISKIGSGAYRDACMSRAKLFDERIFENKVRAMIKNILKETE